MDFPWLKLKAKVSFPILSGWGAWFIFLQRYCLQIREVLSGFPSVYFSLDFKETKVWWLEGRGINPRGKTFALFSLLKAHSSNNKQMMKPEVKGLFHQIWNFLNEWNWGVFFWSEVVAIKSDSPIPGTFLPSASLDCKMNHENRSKATVHGIDNFDTKMKGNRNCLELF